MGGIFISYRREEAEGYAGRLFDKLKEHFGRERVFMDVDAIEPGADFVEVLNNALGSCDVLISVIGKLWLTITDDTGKRRLDNPLDYIRLETKIAIERDIKVIPVLIQETTMPSEQELPDELKKLARRQALRLSNDRWDYDIRRLIDALEKAVGIVTTLKPIPQTGDRRVPERVGVPRPFTFVSTRFFSALILLTVITASVVYYRQNQSSDNKPASSTLTIVPPETVTTPSKPPQVAPQAERSIQTHTPEPSVASAPRVTPRVVKTPKYSVKLSEDRGTIIIIGPNGQETDHIPLDPDRVQKIYNAPDGKWSLALIKVRNKPQFGAMPINLTNGSAIETSEIPSMPNSVNFEKIEVVMGFNNSETKRISLHN